MLGALDLVSRVFPSLRHAIEQAPAKVRWPVILILLTGGFVYASYQAWKTERLQVVQITSQGPRAIVVDQQRAPTANGMTQLTRDYRLVFAYSPANVSFRILVNGLIESATLESLDDGKVLQQWRDTGGASGPAFVATDWPKAGLYRITVIAKAPQDFDVLPRFPN